MFVDDCQPAPGKPPQSEDARLRLPIFMPVCPAPLDLLDVVDVVVWMICRSFISPSSNTERIATEARIEAASTTIQGCQ
jgi:hypothetical protein